MATLITEYLQAAMPASIVVLSLAVAAIFAKMLIRFAERKVDEWQKHLVEAEQARAKMASEVLRDNESLIMKRLSAHFTQVQEMEHYHRTVAGFFMPRYYMSVLLTAGASVAAGVFLFVISANGWGQSPPYLQTAFLSASAIAAFFGLFPQMFSQSANVSRNQHLYFSYVALENHIITLLATEFRAGK